MKTVANELASRLAAVANCAKNDNEFWHKAHSDAALALVARVMPSGSGFDSGTSLDMERSTAERLVFTTAFHHMDGAGMYDGWTHHTVTARASLVHGLVLTVGGRDRNGIKDYVHECFDCALSAPFTE